MNARSLMIVNQFEHIAPQQFYAAPANAHYCSKSQLTVSISAHNFRAKS